MRVIKQLNGQETLGRASHSYIQLLWDKRGEPDRGQDPSLSKGRLPPRASFLDSRVRSYRNCSSGQVIQGCIFPVLGNSCEGILLAFGYPPGRDPHLGTWALGWSTEIKSASPKPDGIQYLPWYASSVMTRYVVTCHGALLLTSVHILVMTTLLRSEKGITRLWSASEVWPRKLHSRLYNGIRKFG